MVCYPHTHSLLDSWMHLKKGFAYTIKEPETSIGNNEISRDIDWRHTQKLGRHQLIFGKYEQKEKLREFL